MITQCCQKFCNIFTVLFLYVQYIRGYSKPYSPAERPSCSTCTPQSPTGHIPGAFQLLNPPPPPAEQGQNRAISRPIASMISAFVHPTHAVANSIPFHSQLSPSVVNPHNVKLSHKPIVLTRRSDVSRCFISEHFVRYIHG